MEGRMKNNQRGPTPKTKHALAPQLESAGWGRLRHHPPARWFGGSQRAVSSIAYRASCNSWELIVQTRSCSISESSSGATYRTPPGNSSSGRVQVFHSGMSQDYRPRFTPPASSHSSPMPTKLLTATDELLERMGYSIPSLSKEPPLRLALTTLFLVSRLR